MFVFVFLSLVPSPRQTHENNEARSFDTLRIVSVLIHFDSVSPARTIAPRTKPERGARLWSVSAAFVSFYSCVDKENNSVLTIQSNSIKERLFRTPESRQR